MLVRDHMTPDPLVLAPEESLRTARQLMKERGLRRFPVLESGKLVGIVTDRDIRQADISSAVVQERRYVEYILDRVQVRGIMSPDPITISPDAPLTEAARLILENKIGGLPVVSGDSLVGIITETDMISALLGMLHDPAPR
jgi:acetoin utilization protein AcuB